MKFHKSQASVFVPDSAGTAEALARITHLSIGAHQDDTEIMAFHGIRECFQAPGKCFGAVTCTDGAGSPRAGKYAAFTDAGMAALRRHEQEKAAVVGDYGALVQLNYSSAEVKGPAREALKDDLVRVLRSVRPEVVYTHNPADKHDTHVAVCFAAIAALREIPPDERPRTVYGCEVWRSLDWVEDEDKVALSVGGADSLAAAVLGVYDSQISGGKRYDVATQARRQANATYYQSHSTDETDELWFALDLTPLVRDASLDPVDHLTRLIDAFRKKVEDKARKYSFGR